MEELREVENELGVMYHLLIDRINSVNGIKYVKEADKGKYSSISLGPIFFNWNQEFHIALDYTIVYPKIYVKSSVQLLAVDISDISRSYIN